MKPILFKPEMVRAILDGHKSVTRRVVKPRYCDSVMEMYQGTLCEASPYKPPIDNGDGTTTRFVRTYVPCKRPYQPGDILYVRETWRMMWDGTYRYRADPEEPKLGWRPSIHMPKEAARIFLRVTDVRVERLQDITEMQAVKEGADRPMHFDELWDSTIKKADLPRYGWAANPYVWCVSFERISKEEAYKDAH